MSSSAPSVSVIIPTYNRAALVARCIASLRVAGISDLEIIVVDDGGNDNTEQVAVAAGALYRRQSNAGPAAARNNGFGVSHGRYVAFIDSDDEWMPQGARRLLDLMDANTDVDVVFADSDMGNETDGFVSFVNTYGGDAFVNLPGSTRANGLRVLERSPFFLQLSTRNVMFLGSMLFRREFFERLGGFSPALCGAADWELFMRSAASGSVAFASGPAVSRYYKHDAGMSTNSDHMEEDFIHALDAVRRKSPLDDAERRHVDSRVRAHVFGWAWLAYEAGNYRAARTRLRMAGSLGQMGMREAGYLALTYLPPRLIAALRRMRRGLTAPS